MYKRILVPIDESDTSNLALAEAIKLAKEQGAQLRLLHIVDVTAAYSIAEMPFPFAEYRKLLCELGDKLLAKCADLVRGSGVTFDTKCLVLDTLGHRIFELIEQEAKSWPADLVVIGTHGRRGFNRFMLGSVAEGVVRLASVPVLCVKGSHTG
jgi:nucleotide-binding universal stress UspA family protein